MHGARCRHDNPEPARFCTECGAPLALSCASCGALLSEGVRFCGACGLSVDAQRAGQARFASPEKYTPQHLAEKILTLRGAIAGERKQVTVLFADLKGSMELLRRGARAPRGGRGAFQRDGHALLAGPDPGPPRRQARTLTLPASGFATVPHVIITP